MLTLRKFHFYKISFLLIILSHIQIGFAQEVVTVDDIYEEPSELRLYSRIISFDSNTTAKEIKMKFKNWAGVRFVNLSKVLVSETESQVVLNYIDEYVYSMGLAGNLSVGNYYKMVAQFKDGKMRVVVFDDGNTYVPASQGAPSVPARSSHYANYFKNRKEWKNKGMFQKPIYRRIIGYIQNNQEFFTSLESEIKKPTVPVLQDDW